MHILFFPVNTKIFGKFLKKLRLTLRIILDNLISNWFQIAKIKVVK